MEEDAALRDVVKKALEGKGVLAQIRVSIPRSSPRTIAQDSRLKSLSFVYNSSCTHGQFIQQPQLPSSSISIIHTFAEVDPCNTRKPLCLHACVFAHIYSGNSVLSNISMLIPQQVGAGVKQLIISCISAVSPTLLLLLYLNPSVRLRCGPPCLPSLTSTNGRLESTCPILLPWM